LVDSKVTPPRLKCFDSNSKFRDPDLFISKTPMSSVFQAMLRKKLTSLSSVLPVRLVSFTNKSMMLVFEDTLETRSPMSPRSSSFSDMSK